MSVEPVPSAATPPEYDLGVQDQLVYLHLPKTGGVTLNALIEQHFAAGEICPFYRGYEWPVDTDPGMLQGYRYLRGHTAYTFGWRPPRVYSHRNVTAGRPLREQLAAHTLAEIEALCETDVALYQYACQGFEARFQHMSEALLTRYGRPAHLRQPGPLPAETLFELLEQHYFHRQAIRRKLSSPTPPGQPLHYTFEQAFSGDGWHAREDHPPHGVFCWSGPGAEASLDFTIETEGDQVIQFHVLAGVTPEVLASLTLAANDRLIPLLQKPHPGGGVLFHGYLPQSLWAGRELAWVRLVFQVAQILPASVMKPESQDKSERGIALKSIEIKPAAT